MGGGIFWPVIALAALTAAVWIRMYVVRLRELSVRRIAPQAVATSRQAAATLEQVTPADNFRNLFEVPVLFYAICAFLALADAVTTTQLGLAWLFVLTRALHSLIHLTYNNVVHRFAVCVAGTVCVFAMWFLFALHLAAEPEPPPPVSEPAAAVSS